MMKKITTTIQIAGITLGLIIGIEMFFRHIVPVDYVNIETDVIYGNAKHIKKDNYLLLPKNAKWQARTSEYDVVYKTNSEHMRDENTYLDKERMPGKKRVLLLGDSFTQGIANNYQDSWPVLLEEKLNDVEIVKAGISDSNQYREYYYLKDIIHKYNPDYVMIGFVQNDIIGNRKVGDAINLENIKFLKKGKNKKAHSHYYIKDTILQKSHAVQFCMFNLLKIDSVYLSIALKTYRKAYYLREKEMEDKVVNKINITKQLFKQINELVRENHAKLIVLSIPQRLQVLLARNPKQGLFPYEIDRILEDYAEQEKFVWFNSLRSFSETSKETHHIYDGHLNSYGNSIVANYAKVELEKILLAHMQVKH